MRGLHEGYAGAICTRVCTRGLQRKGLHEGVAEGLCSWALHEGLHDSLAHEGGVKVLHVGFSRGGHTGRFCTRLLHGTQSFPPPLFPHQLHAHGASRTTPTPLHKYCSHEIFPLHKCSPSPSPPPCVLPPCTRAPLPHSPLAQAPPCTLPLTQAAPLHTSPCTTTPLS